VISEEANASLSDQPGFGLDLEEEKLARCRADI
jgi:hypothetical protein